MSQGVRSLHPFFQSTLFCIRSAEHQRQLDRLLVAIAIVAPLSCLVAAAALLASEDSWAGSRFLALYVAPMFLAAPLWVRARLHAVAATGGEPGWRPMLDLAIVLLSFARFVLGEVLPFSGHMLFLTYTALLPASRPYHWLAVALLIETTVFKLLIWNDVWSWVIGMVVGALAAAAVRWAGSGSTT